MEMWGRGWRPPRRQRRQAGSTTEATEPSTEVLTTYSMAGGGQGRPRAGSRDTEPLSSGTPTCGSGTNRELGSPVPAC